MARACLHSTIRLILSCFTLKTLMLGVLPSGAAGGIGQPLAMLMKLCPYVGELRLYDIVGTEGVGADISHISTSAKVIACW